MASGWGREAAGCACVGVRLGGAVPVLSAGRGCWGGSGAVQCLALAWVRVPVCGRGGGPRISFHWPALCSAAGPCSAPPGAVGGV